MQPNFDTHKEAMLPVPPKASSIPVEMRPLTQQPVAQEGRRTEDVSLVNIDDESESKGAERKQDDALGV